MCYAAGFGVSKDIVESYKWATLAASHNYTNAVFIFDILSKKPGITPKQIAEANRRADEFAKTNSFHFPAIQPPDIILPYPNRFGAE